MLCIVSIQPNSHLSLVVDSDHIALNREVLSVKFQQFWKAIDGVVDDANHIWESDWHELLQIQAYVFNE